MKKSMLMLGALLLTGTLSASFLSDMIDQAAKDAQHQASGAQDHLAQNVGTFIRGTNNDEVEAKVYKVMKDRHFINIRVDMDGSGWNGKGRRVSGERTDGKDLGGQAATNVLTNMMGGDRGKIISGTHVSLIVFVRRRWADDGQGDGGGVMVSLDGEDCDVQQNGQRVNCRKWLQERKDKFKADVVDAIMGVSPAAAQPKKAHKK